MPWRILWYTPRWLIALAAVIAGAALGRALGGVTGDLLAATFVAGALPEIVSGIRRWLSDDGRRELPPPSPSPHREKIIQLPAPRDDEDPPRRPDQRRAR